MKFMNRKNTEHFARIFCVSLFASFAIACLGALSVPEFAFAEQKSGINFVLPSMIEFVPMVIAFILIAIILAKFGWPAFEKMIENRNNLIEGNIKDSEKTKQEAEAELASYKQKLSHATEEANKIVADAKQTGQAASEQLKATAQQDADEMIQKAKGSIEIDKRKAAHEIQTDTADLAVLVTKKVIGEDLTTEEHRKLIEKYIKESSSIAG